MLLWLLDKWSYGAATTSSNTLYLRCRWSYGAATISHTLNLRLTSGMETPSDSDSGGHRQRSILMEVEEYHEDEDPDYSAGTRSSSSSSTVTDDTVSNSSDADPSYVQPDSEFNSSETSLDFEEGDSAPFQMFPCPCCPTDEIEQTEDFLPEGVSDAGTGEDADDVGYMADVDETGKCVYFKRKLDLLLNFKPGRKKRRMEE